MRAGWLVIVLAACTHAPPQRFTAGDTMLPTFPIGAPLQGTKLDRPERGRVIVFRFPAKPGSSYVKRIVGVAGDTVAIDGTAVVVNGKPIPRCYVGAWEYEAHQGEIWLEALQGAKWLVFHDTTGVHTPPHGPWIVAPGQVFVLGDNRENSYDSRMWNGLPLGTIIGVGPDSPVLPKGAEALQPALARCTTESRSKSSAIGATPTRPSRARPSSGLQRLSDPPRDRTTSSLNHVFLGKFRLG